MGPGRPPTTSPGQQGRQGADCGPRERYPQIAVIRESYPRAFTSLENDQSSSIHVTTAPKSSSIHVTTQVVRTSSKNK